MNIMVIIPPTNVSAVGAVSSLDIIPPVGSLISFVVYAAAKIPQQKKKAVNTKAKNE